MSGTGRASVSRTPFSTGFVPRVRTLLPKELRTFQWQTRTQQLKLWYEQPDVHYEVWLRPRLQVAELGLHFESDLLTNQILLSGFLGKRTKIKKALGPLAKIEAWDKGWARVWETHPLIKLTPALEAHLGLRLSEYIVHLEPLLQDLLPEL